MPQHLHLDYESFSLAELSDVGTYRYAFDPSTEILCAAMALGDEEPMSWVPGAEWSEDDFLLERYWDALENPDVLIYAHNAQMEYAMSQALMWKTWGIAPPDIRRFRCTASLARRAALPAKLEKLSEFLGTVVKDKTGKRLIKKFSMLQPAKKPTKKNPLGVPIHRIRPEDDPEDFARFVEYCRQDVRAEQEVARRLAYFGDALNDANYTLHEIINARGVAVNVAALRHAQKLIDEETEIVSAKFRDLVGLDITQNAKVLTWARENGYPYDDLQQATVESFLEAEQDDWMACLQEGENIVRTALRLRASVSYAAIKKVQTMLACVGPGDNRVRGTLVHHGATTGRSSGALIQPQNFKRPTISNSEDAYRDICAGISREMLDIVYGAPLEVISSCIRHFIDNGKPILDCDYSSIEARITPWVAGEESTLEDYRQGVKTYERMAAMIYGIPEKEVNRFPQRFVGKEAELGCGFGLGAPRFRVACKKKGYDLPEGLEFKVVKAWRKKHSKIVKFWEVIDHAAKSAVLHKGKLFPAGEFISFKCITTGDIEFLLMRLPSGRKLAYPWPRIVAGKFEGTTAVSFYQNLKGVVWGHNSGIWGGVWTENAVQAVAADIMCHGAQNAENAGYEIAALIHDQALAYHREGQTPEEFVSLLTDLPEWAANLPIAAEGALVSFYKKD